MIDKENEKSNTYPSKGVGNAYACSSAKHYDEKKEKSPDQGRGFSVISIFI